MKYHKTEVTPITTDQNNIRLPCQNLPLLSLKYLSVRKLICCLFMFVNCYAVIPIRDYWTLPLYTLHLEFGYLMSVIFSLRACERINTFRLTLHCFFSILPCKDCVVSGWTLHSFLWRSRKLSFQYGSSFYHYGRTYVRAVFVSIVFLLLFSIIPLLALCDAPAPYNRLSPQLTSTKKNWPKKRCISFVDTHLIAWTPKLYFYFIIVFAKLQSFWKWYYVVQAVCIISISTIWIRVR